MFYSLFRCFGICRTYLLVNFAEINYPLLYFCSDFTCEYKCMCALNVFSLTILVILSVDCQHFDFSTSFAGLLYNRIPQNIDIFFAFLSPLIRSMVCQLDIYFTNIKQKYNDSVLLNYNNYDDRYELKTRFVRNSLTHCQEIK